MTKTNQEKINLTIIAALKRANIVRGATLTNIIYNELGFKVGGELLRKYIQHLRLACVPIIASREGYYLCRTKNDAEKANKYVKSRILEMEKEIKALHGIEDGVKQCK